MFRKIKGTYDLMQEEMRCQKKAESLFHSFLTLYNFSEIRTPIMEYNEVFHRAAEHSEMVSKETYNFLDKKGRALTLRPEGTAGVVRSYVENKLDKTTQLSKFYYYGPCFRYERPQKGRYRQFHQLGVEVLGSQSPFLDVEIITLADQLLKYLGLTNITIKINSLGDEKDYRHYLTVFKTYLQLFLDDLCPLCQERFQSNLLRIWDCKNCHQKPFLKQAPKIIDYLSPASNKRFQQVLSGLTAMQVNFEISHNLVRGLDYYTNTVFEIVSNNSSNVKSVLGGGGCYENLVKAFGGNDVPGIGFALGMERLMSALQDNHFCNYNCSFDLDIFLLISDPHFFNQGLTLAQNLRHQGFRTTLNYHFLPFVKALKQAFKTNPHYLLILGAQEFEKQQITIKNNQTQTQTTILQKDVALYLSQQGAKSNCYEK